ncbi:wings apart-like protein regulation of heterochromatin-domain-containing protein [Aspergillus aurantiobrunneus]
MSQNRKRPVTYGKSPLNRFEPYMPGLGNSTRGPASNNSSIHGPAAAAFYPPESSVRPFRHPRPSKILSCPSHSQVKDNRKAMQRKRRRFLPEEDGSQMSSKAPMGANLERVGLRDNNDLLSTISHHDYDQDGSEVSQFPSSSGPFETNSANRPSSSYWLSARRQKPTSQKANSVAARKRLIDSLGTTDEGGEDFAPVPAELSNLSHSSRDNIAHETNLTHAHQHLPQKSSEPKSCTPGCLQRNPSASVVSVLRSSGVTYSRQRSFLNDSLGFTNCEPHDMGNLYEFETKKEPPSLRSSRIPSEEDDAHDGKPVRSIHELRQAGDNARFREVVDSIFEDIEDTHNSRSGKCCGLAELCGKLLDPQFIRRFCEQGFDERMVNCTSSTLDTVSASLALSAHKLIIIGGHASRVFSESLWPRILELFPSLLDIEDDLLVLAREPSIGLSKTAQASIRGMRPHLLSAIGSPSLLSPQLLALECAKSSLIVLRENGHTIPPFSTSLLEKLMNLMEAAMNAIRDPTASTSRGQVKFLDLVFSILENYSVTSGSFDCNHCRCFHRLSRLHSLLTLDNHGQGYPISMSYIRVILNLTNKEPTLCDNFATPDLVSGLVKIVTREPCDISRDFCDGESSPLNEVILALGTLINLAEKTERSRAMLMNSNSRAVPFLHHLLEQFSSSVNSIDQAQSVSEVHWNVVAGYLSILLLTICLNNEARLLVKDYLAGDGLALVLSTASKFLQYHREVEKGHRPFETWEQGEPRLTARLEHIISQICRLEGLADEVY